jgi:hypothetical protein
MAAPKTPPSSVRSDIVAIVGTDHQRFADPGRIGADRGFEPGGDLGIFAQIGLRILAALADADLS